MKKMRKLLPALAMLLVSAIMMSTASFAWFTMNEAVTATGMQVQAIATGSLVVGETPLTSANAATSVDFKTGVQSMRPSTITTTTSGDPAVTTMNWQQPNGADVDPFTGKVKEGKTLSNITITNENRKNYFFDKEIYIGSAGDPVKSTLKLDLSAPVRLADDIAVNAYAVAVYIIDDASKAEWADNATVADTAVPDHILHVDSNADRNTWTTTKQYDIPSVAGVVNNPVGIKVIFRVFIDGNLDALKNDSEADLKTRTYTAYQKVTLDEEGQTVSTPILYDATKSYFTDANGTQPAQVGEFKNGVTEVPEDWYYAYTATEKLAYNYINTDDVPTSSATLEIKVSTTPIAQP